MQKSAAEKREYAEWLTLCNQIKNSTGVMVDRNESEKDKAIRKAKLCEDFVAFAKYYFGHFMDSEFGWFHKKAAKLIQADPNIFIALEWSREHAKSVLADIFVPMWLYARKELTGMVIVSANQDKAETLLSDVQAQFVANELWLNDYGQLAAAGDWRNGQFSTIDDFGFWAFGRGQSPRGIRKQKNRPNYAVIDDIDDKVIVRNEERVRDAVDWILEDLFGALSLKGARMVFAGNRIHKKSILAHIVGDIEPGDPKRERLQHIKVFALENPKTHQADYDGTPAWKERYTVEQVKNKMALMGYRAAQREYFHNPIEEGSVFKHEWIAYEKPLPYNKYDEIVIYGDPSFKNTKASDYKAIVAVGKTKTKIHILKVWCKQTTINTMVNVFYDYYEIFRTLARYYIEANMLQDLLFDDEFKEVGEQRGYQLPIRQDKRKKPDKFTRIENLSPLFERSLIFINEQERQSADMQTFIQQLLSFPEGHDDAPDALEGAVSIVQSATRSSNFKPRLGNFTKSSNRM
jgi:predicted phage terminase large subunit-like protein